MLKSIILWCLISVGTGGSQTLNAPPSTTETVSTHISKEDCVETMRKVRTVRTPLHEPPNLACIEMPIWDGKIYD